jgi:acyl-CoA thioester hydrolase
LSDVRASDLPGLELSGKVVDGEHRYPLRIFYEDTDAGGIVYYARYLQFAERARTEMLRLAGIEQSKLRDSHDIFFAVHRCEVDYRRPARLDDLVEVRSRLTELRGARLSALQSICRAGEELVRLVVVIASVSGDGRPARIPAPIRAALEPFIQPLKQG